MIVRNLKNIKIVARLEPRMLVPYNLQVNIAQGAGWSGPGAAGGAEREDAFATLGIRLQVAALLSSSALLLSLYGWCLFDRWRRGKGCNH